MSTSIANINGSSIETNTPEGAAYVRKITHPPSATDALYRGRPDCSQPNVVLMELKSEQNISPAITFATSAAVTTTVFPSSILFLKTSGAFCATIPFFRVQYNGGSHWMQAVDQPLVASTQPALSQVNPPAVVNQGYNPSNFAIDVSNFRPSYNSSTYYLNATAFNNQGMVTTAKFKPNVVVSTFLDAVSAVSGQSRINLLKTIKQNPALKRVAVDDFESVDLGYQNNFYVQFLDMGRGPTGTSINTTFNNADFISYLPNNASDLINFSPKAVSNPAVDGAFVVQQNVDPVSLWQSNTNARIGNPAADVATGGLIFSMFRYFNTTTNVWNYSNIFSGAVAVPASQNPPTATVDTPWNNLDFSFTLFEGLTIPTGTSSTTGLPYITVKSFSGMELQVSEGSSLRSFQKQLPLPDSKALEMACGIFHSRPDALPASANDWGTLGKVLLQALPVAADWLIKSFSGRSKPAAPKPVSAPIKIKEKPKKKVSDPILANRVSVLKNRIAQQNRLLQQRQQPQVQQLPTYSPMPMNTTGTSMNSRFSQMTVGKPKQRQRYRNNKNQNPSNYRC